MELLDYEKDHLERVRAGLAECMVLLRKDGAFPLEGPCTLAAYGNGVRCSVKGGTGSGDVNAHTVVTIEQGLRDAGFTLEGDWWLDEYDVRRAKAKKAFYKQLRKEAKAVKQNPVFYALGAIMPEPEYSIPMRFTADAAIYVLARVAGEGADRKVIPGDVLLTETEIRDILLLNERYERFMLVVNTGAPVDLTPVREVGNILVLSQLGSQMGYALADVLLGRANPSGKLAATWSAAGDYCPDIELGDPDDTRYREGIYVGYRYFDTVAKRAQYPFGFGLSYTEFALGDARASLEGGRMTLAVNVENTGSRAGKQVVQAYVTAPEGALKKPWQELAGFAKTALLEPGASEEAAISFDFANLASFDERAGAYVLEAGEYVVRLGTSSVDTAPVAVVELVRDAVVRTVRPVAGRVELEECGYERAPRNEKLGALPRFALEAACVATPAPRYDVEPAVDPAIAALSDEELVYLGIGHFSGKSSMLSLIGDAAADVAGAAGETTLKLRGAGIEPLIMADGPAGLRLARDFYRDERGAHSLGHGSIPEGVLDVLSAPVRALLSLRSGSNKIPKGAAVEHQYCTALPVGTAIAQSWNLEYAEACGDIVGSEMERFGVHLWLAPSINIQRSIRCGRNFEYFSEDPLVTGKMAAALVRGVQSHPGCGATVKHFAANNQETNRYFNNSQVSERALREIYLRGFQICIREGEPRAVMTSYNLLNGVHTSENRALIEDYLRAECGFDGIVVTDWIIDVFNSSDRHPAARARRVVAAGGDLVMPGSTTDFDDVMAALRDGALTRHQLAVNGSRVYWMSKRLHDERTQRVG